MYTESAEVLVTHLRPGIAPLDCTGKTNLGGDPSYIVKKLRQSFSTAEIYCIGITGSPNLMNLDKFASAPIEKHVFVLRNYNSMQWLVEILTDGTIGEYQLGLS